MNDTITLVLIIAGIGFVAIMILSAALNLFVALKSPPNRRAVWTVGIAYTLAAAGLAYFLGTLSGPPLQIEATLAPLAMLPSAIIIFLWRRRDYRKAWLDDDNLPDGVELANDDWRFGLIVLLLIVGAFVVRALYRYLMQS